MNYDLVEQYGIDDGELDGLTAQQAFTLGVEWADMLSLLNEVKNAEPEDECGVCVYIHAANVARLKCAALRRGLGFREEGVDDASGRHLMRFFKRAAT